MPNTAIAIFTRLSCMSPNAETPVSIRSEVVPPSVGVGSAYAIVGARLPTIRPTNNAQQNANIKFFAFFIISLLVIIDKERVTILRVYYTYK